MHTGVSQGLGFGRMGFTAMTADGLSGAKCIIYAARLPII